MNEHDCIHAGRIETMAKAIDAIYAAIVGDLEKKGLKKRVEDLEDWRGSTTTRVKNRKAWVFSILGGVVSGLLMVVVSKIVG